MRRSSFISTLFLIAAASVVLVWSPSASAAFEVSIDNCNAQVTESTGWNAFGELALTDNCAAGEGLQIPNAELGPGAVIGWYFANPELEIVSYSFDIDGGDTTNGIRYGVRGCDLCADDYVIGARGSSSPTEHVEVPLPTSSEGVSIYAECTDPGLCNALPTELRISNLSVTVTDSTSPYVNGLIPNSQEDEFGFRGWTNKTQLPVDLVGSDTGFGLYSAEVRIGGAPTLTWNFDADCPSAMPLSSPYMCPQYVERSGVADLTGFSDGIYDIQFAATDGAANAGSTDAGRIGIDRAAPAAPQGATLQYSPPGWPGQRWTSDPNVTLTWDPASEVLEPDFESPIDSQSVRLRRAGSATVLDLEAPFYQQSLETTLIADGEWSFDVNFNDQAGNAGASATKSVGLDVDAPNPPQGLAAEEWYSDAGLGTGPRINWLPPEENPLLESGVCGYVVRIDGSAGANPVFGEDDAIIGTSWPLPAGLPEGENFAHVRAVSCAGVASSTVTVSIKVDTVAPHIALAGVTAPDQWSNSFQQALLSATDDGSGVEAVGYALDDDATTWISADNAAIDLPEGMHELTLFARDAAGNVSTLAREVRTDTVAPSVDLAPAAVSDPTLASGTVLDSDSGLASASIELRRVDQAASTAERQWQAVGGAEPITRGATTAVNIARRIDDSQLEAGDYELRINAADVAGNSATAGDFAIRAMRLPLRRPAELSAAIADVAKVCRTGAGKPCPKSRKCKAKQRCRTVQVIRTDTAKSAVVRTWSQKSAIVGDVLDTNGAPLVGVNVAISAAVPFHDAEPFGSVVTDAAGHFEKLLPAGPTRVFTARIDGNATQQPATATATLTVRSDIEFKPSPLVVRAGSTMKLAGRVLHPEWLPVGGVSVRFQWYSPNGWVTFDNPTRTDARGRFSSPYPWSASAKRSTIRLRARIDSPAGWPFAPGSSDSVRVSVLPKR